MVCRFTIVKLVLILTKVVITKWLPTAFALLLRKVEEKAIFIQNIYFKHQNGRKVVV